MCSSLVLEKVVFIDFYRENWGKTNNANLTVQSCPLEACAFEGFSVEVLVLESVDFLSIFIGKSRQTRTRANLMVQIFLS